MTRKGGDSKRRTGKNKSKETYKKFGKYTAKSLRLRQAKLEVQGAINAEIGALEKNDVYTRDFRVSRLLLCVSGSHNQQNPTDGGQPRISNLNSGRPVRKTERRV
ncbi:hypothetical protein AAMO2058_000887900 [Amorphochlora amoebiformis]